ncbi:hypothetical protein L6R53_28785 [Myxococcota bacterium]|nr:hypothetical protein [Myxococcota bacterium]
MLVRPPWDALSRVRLDPDTELTEELALVPVVEAPEEERHICAAACEHQASVEVQHAAVDKDAGVLVVRMAARIELDASDCFCVQEVRLRTRLIFRYHGLQHVQRVVQFLSTYDEDCTYRETAEGIGRVLDVETERWDLTRREVAVFEHEQVLLRGGFRQSWYLPWESACHPLDWPLRLPTHRPESAGLYLAPVLYYRLDRRPQCSHDHCRGLGDFMVRPPRRTRVIMA